jgi:hypothetical protein
MGGGRGNRGDSTFLANCGNDGRGIHIWICGEEGDLTLSEVRYILVTPPFNDGGRLGRGFATLRGIAIEKSYSTSYQYYKIPKGKVVVRGQEGDVDFLFKLTIGFFFFFFFFFLVNGSAMAEPLLAMYLLQTSTHVVKKYLHHQMGDLNRSPKTNRNIKERKQPRTRHTDGNTAPMKLHQQKHSRTTSQLTHPFIFTETKPIEKK